MPRARNKDDLLKSANENYAKLMEMILNMTENQLNTPFDFSGDASKKEAHWARDKKCSGCADSSL
ncbi:MAG: ClbS/DfsB family four-helix bundle protein [Treponema sp.]|nr:ClbS/DfsB family four-helix bundle protein [Treponema sp.]